MSSQASHTSSHVLVVAGDYDIVSQVKLAFTRDRLMLALAFNHREALHMLSGDHFDLILVDAVMSDRYSGAGTLSTLAEVRTRAPLVAFVLDGKMFQDASQKADRVITSLDEALIRHTVLGLLDAGHSDSPSTAAYRAARLNEALSRRVDETETLYAVSRSLTEVLDVQEVLNRVVEAACRLTNAEEGMLLLPEADDDRLVLGATMGMEKDDTQNFRIRMHNSIAGEVFRSGLPRLIGAKGPQKVKTEYFAKSLVYVPILHQGQPIGVLGVNNRLKNDLFDLHHQELLINLASYAAIAIENARIHEESLRRARELETLVKASQTLNMSLSLEESLRNICRQLAFALSVSQVSVYRWSVRTMRLRSQARLQRLMWHPDEAPRVDLLAMPLQAQALREGKPLWLDSHRFKQWPDASGLQVPGEPGASAVLMIPVRQGEQLLGAVQAFYVGDTSSRQPSKESYYRVQRLAQDAICDLQKRQPDEAVEPALSLIEAIPGILDADWCRVLIERESDHQFVQCAAVGVAVWPEGLSHEIDLLQYPDILTALETRDIINIRGDSATLSPGSLMLVSQTGLRVLLALPLVHHSQVQGLVVIGDTLVHRKFLKRDIDIAQAIVGQAATALENARLVHDLERSVQDLRDAQERLVRTARLSAMGELAAVVAHQINNPLTTIIVDAEMMLLDEPEDSANYRSLSAILRAGKRAAGVARRLLAISRPDEGNSEPDLIGVIDTLKGVLSLVRTHIERDKITIVEDLPDDLEYFVLAVRGQLDDVWLNLLLNAHDALVDRDDARIGIDVSIDDGSIRVVVWDNGPGIPDSIQSEVFRPFYTTKAAGEGTGLGLYVCSTVIEQINGELSLESQAEQGARFTVTLPLVSSQSKARRE